MMAQRKQLIGRTITGVEFRPFDNGSGGTAHNPVLILDNGRRLLFMTEETDTGEYGTSIIITDPMKEAK
jgi:hypothetical protein